MGSIAVAGDVKGIAVQWFTCCIMTTMSGVCLVLAAAITLLLPGCKPTEAHQDLRDDQCNFRCYTQNEDVPSKRNTCHINLSFNCTSSVVDYSLDHSLGPGSLTLETDAIDDANSRLKFALPLLQPGRTSVEILGKAIDSTCRRVTLTAECDGDQPVRNKLLTKALCVLKACIQLPHGSYNVSAHQEPGG